MRRPHLSAALAFLTILLYSGVEARRPLIAADVLVRDFEVCRRGARTCSPSMVAIRISPERIGMCQRGRIHGVVEKGDYEKVRAFYRANHPILDIFSLVSPGGDVEEALKIGQLFRTACAQDPRV